MKCFAVRYGKLGAIGTFRSAIPLRYNPGDDVVCRTVRGVETGQVLNDWDDDKGRAPDGEILRRLSRDDRLLQQRLERHRARAIDACARTLSDRGIPAVLLDAELTFDGSQLFFYFLGPPPKELDQITAELSDLYQAKIHYQRFSETLANGCGPDCGNKEGGCDSGACSTCAAHGGCVSRRT